MKIVIVVAVLTIALAMGRPVIAVERHSSERFIQVNGVRLEYLDWGGKGPNLILIPGLGDSAHLFDDIAPQLTARFHVLAYSRRGCGESEAKGPYDKATLAADLVGLMDRLGIRAANLAGHSAGGDELTELASKHPSRVLRLVYLDAAYDWSSPQFRSLYHAIPSREFELPKGATSSFANYLAYQRSTIYRSVTDLSRVNSEIRARVSIDRNGEVTLRPSPSLMSQYFSALMANAPQDYSHIQSPALAIYASHSFLFALARTSQQKNVAAMFDKKYWIPFQNVSKKQFTAGMRYGRVIALTGTNHAALLMQQRDVIARIITAFLQEPSLLPIEHRRYP